MPAKHQTGFTLIEAMVTVGVMAMLAALAVPSFTTYIEKSRVRGAADDVINIIAQARQAGVKYDRDVMLNVTGSGATWCVGARQANNPASVGDAVPAAIACDCTGAQSTKLCDVDGQRLVVDSSNYSGVTLTDVPSSLTFDGRLGVVNGGASDSLDLTSSGGRYVLTVNISALGQGTACSKVGNILGYPSC